MENIKKSYVYCNTNNIKRVRADIHMFSVWAHIYMKYLGCFNETDAVRLYARCMCFLSTHEPLESLTWMIQKGTCLTSVRAWQGLCGSASFCSIHLGRVFFSESCFTNQNVLQNLFFYLLSSPKTQGSFQVCPRRFISWRTESSK